jgi:hypothetical protein
MVESLCYTFYRFCYFNRLHQLFQNEATNTTHDQLTVLQSSSLVQ